jgi:hypothetical protein
VAISFKRSACVARQAAARKDRSARDQSIARYGTGNLGDKLGLRRFHDVVIDNGALPLDAAERADQPVACGLAGRQRDRNRAPALRNKKAWLL